MRKRDPDAERRLTGRRLEQCFVRPSPRPSRARSSLSRPQEVLQPTVDLDDAGPRADDGSPGQEAKVHARQAPRHRQADEDTGYPTDKSTPIARSVRKAEGLDAETAGLPKIRMGAQRAHF